MRGRIAGSVAALSLIAGAVGVLCAAILSGIAAPTGPQNFAQRGAPGAAPVDAELVLAVDVSRSIESSGWNRWRPNAFCGGNRSPELRA